MILWNVEYRTRTECGSQGALVPGGMLSFLHYRHNMYEFDLVYLCQGIPELGI